MSSRIKIKDFKIKPLSMDVSSSDLYYSADIKIMRRPYEICLEPCLNGFDVAIYDANQGLVLPKLCTNTQGFVDFGPRALAKAVELANDLIGRIYQT